MRTILDESREPLQSAIHSGTTELKAQINTMQKFHPFFRPIPTKNVSEDLTRDALGFMDFTMRKFDLNISTIWV